MATTIRFHIFIAKSLNFFTSGNRPSVNIPKTIGGLLSGNPAKSGEQSIEAMLFTTAATPSTLVMVLFGDSFSCE